MALSCGGLVLLFLLSSLLTRGLFLGARERRLWQCNGSLFCRVRGAGGNTGGAGDTCVYGKVGVCIHVCVSTISVKQVSIFDPLAFLALKTLLITWLLQLHSAKNAAYSVGG